MLDPLLDHLPLPHGLLDLLLPWEGWSWKEFLSLPWAAGGLPTALCGDLSSSVVHGGLPGLLGVTGVPGSVYLGLDLSAGWCCTFGESFSFSRADFSHEMKLKAFFSTMSCLAFLALIHSSKVLKEIDLLTVSSVVFKETFVPFSPRVMKGIELQISISMSWKETFVLALPMVLKEFSLHLMLTVSLTLSSISFSLMTLMLCISMVLKGGNLFLCCSVLPCISLTGSWKECQCRCT